VRPRGSKKSRRTLKIRRQRGGDYGTEPTTLIEWFNNAHALFSKITDEDTMNGYPILKFKTTSLSLNSMRETTKGQTDTIETSNGVRENIDNIAKSLTQVFANIYGQIKGLVPSGQITLGAIKQIINGEQTDSTQPNYFNTLKNNEVMLRTAASGLGFTINTFKDHPFFTFALLMNATEGDPKPVLGPIDDAVDATPVAPAAPMI